VKAVDDLNTYTRLVLAFGIGLAVGVERGWRMRDEPAGTRAAGVRTFALIGFLGGTLGTAGHFVGDFVIAAGALGFFVLVAAAYFGGLSRSPDRGLTTEIAALVTFVLGVIAVRGEMVVAASAAVLLIAVLDLKDPVHRLVAKIEAAEITGAIKLLLISVVLLPLLPNQGYGPGGLLNPYAMWWMVVVIAGISSAAYAAIRITGPKAGTLLTALLGGLASSTAVTLSLARLAERTPSLSQTFGAGIALASALMFIRALIVVFIFHPPAGWVLAVPLMLAALGALGSTILLLNFKLSAEGKTRSYPDDMTTSPRIELGQPTDITTAVKFGLALVVVSIAVHYGNAWFGTDGLVAASAVTGLVDIDAITITVGRLGGAGMATTSDVVAATLAAILVNTGAKAVYALAIARRALVRPVALIFVSSVGAAAVGYGLVRL
jgi:uncharacterized membrane protein (DUF4010 family)